MTAVFSQVLNMSMTGSVVILTVMLVRLLLKRLPKIFSYVLWSVVLFRLLCPVTFSAPISLLDVMEPEIKEISGNTSIATYLPDDMALKEGDLDAAEENLPANPIESMYAPAQCDMVFMYTFAMVWSAGGTGLLLYSIVQYVILRRRLIGAIHLHGKTYLADYIDTAFVVGLLQPRIYLPSKVPERERTYILAHEQHHIRRFDHIFKLLAYIALCIHWFNPLVWIAFAMAGEDMEMSCDEAVIKKLGIEIRADYSASLLRLAMRKKIFSGLPLAFGEGDTRGRVLNMAKWKKPAKWVAVICAILCVCIVALCALNPQEKKSIEELTRHTSDGPVGTGIGDLNFTYPAGLTSELREVENWTREDKLRNIQNLPNRRQWNSFFIDNGTDFGGVVDFIMPENREIQLDKMNLPSQWTGLDYIAGSSNYPYVEKEYTLVKDGKDYIQLYLYTYSGRGYFLWFYVEQGNPAHKRAILESVELGNGSKHVTKLKQNEEVSLGLFNVLVPKGYGYFRNETVILEITQKDLLNNQMILGCVTARPGPNISDGDEDLVNWIDEVGIDLHQEGIDYTIIEEPPFGDVAVTLKEMRNGKTVIQRAHYFFIAGDIVYDLWIDQLHMDPKIEEAILESIWLKDATTTMNHSRAESTVQKQTHTANSSNSITDSKQFPSGSLALEKCKAVIDLVQNGSYHIQWDRIRISPTETSEYSIEYLYHDDDWMHITKLQTGKGIEHQFRMKINGRYFYDLQSPVQKNATWRNEDTISELQLPWMVSYNWNDASVAYINTLQHNRQEIVTLRIDEPFYGYPTETNCYYTDFVFDSGGNFVKVQLYSDITRNNELWSAVEAESVISLDPSAVNAIIQKEYQRILSQNE